MFIYHCVYSDLGDELFFEEEGETKNGGVDFEIGDCGSYTCIEGRRKIFQNWGNVRH